MTAVVSLALAIPILLGSEAGMGIDRQPSFGEVLHVTATAAERRAIDLPYVIETLDRGEYALQQHRTLPEAMREMAGVIVQKTGHGQGSPFIRGFTGFRNVFLIDGIRLNNSVLRDGPNQYWNTVDAFSLDRLEVVKGPVSVLYGSDAVGGTVNAITHDPRPGGGDDRLFHLRWSSAENSVVGRARADGAIGTRWRWSVGATGKDFGDLEAGGDVGLLPHTGYNEWDGDLKLVADLGGGRSWTFAWQSVEVDDAWRTHRTIYGVPWRGTTVGDELRRSLDQRRQLGYVQYRQVASNRFFDRLTASLSSHGQQEERLRVRSDGRSDRTGFDVTTTGLWLRMEKETGSSTWTYGLEYYHDEVDSFSRRYAADGSLSRIDIQGPVADDASYGLWGVFVQNEWRLGMRDRLLTGLRATGADAEAGRVQDPDTGAPISISGSWNQVVSDVRWIHELGESRLWRIFGGVSQGFRAPNLSDLSRFDSARSNEVETPAPGLEAEQFVSYELGFKVATVQASGTLAFFYTDIEDLIQRVPRGRVIDGDREITKTNSGNGFVGGIEISGRARLGNDWSLSGAFTWLDGEADTYPTSDPLLVREPIDRLMPPTVHLGLRWQPRDAGFWFELAGTTADRQDKLSTRDAGDTQRIPPGGTPGYEVLTLRGGWQIRNHVELLAGIENVTDEVYRIHGSGLNEPGFGLVLGLELGF